MWLYFTRGSERTCQVLHPRVRSELKAYWLSPSRKIDGFLARRTLYLEGALALSGKQSILGSRHRPADCGPSSFVQAMDVGRYKPERDNTREMDDGHRIPIPRGSPRLHSVVNIVWICFGDGDSQKISPRRHYPSAVCVFVGKTIWCRGFGNHHVDRPRENGSCH